MNAGKVDRKPYLLLVEDDQDDAFLALRTLRKNKFPLRVEHVLDGPEALEYVDAADILPAVILLDDRLPRLSGPEVLAQLRSNPRTKQVPVLMLSSSEEEQDRCRDGREDSSRGPDACLKKPLNWRELKNQLARLGVLAAKDKMTEPVTVSATGPPSARQGKRPAAPRQGTL